MILNKLSKLMAYTVRNKPLAVPPLTSVVEAIKNGLTPRYESVNVEICTNPVNFYKPPYYLAGETLNGSISLFDFGGVHNLGPVACVEAQYPLEEISDQLKLPPGTLFIGAGAGPHHLTKRASEAVYNYRVGGVSNPKDSLNRGFFAECDSNSPNGFRCIPWGDHIGPVGPDWIGSLLCVKPNGNETPTPLIHINVKRRVPLATTGKEWDGNFIGAVREALANRFDPAKEPIGMGGVMRVTSGAFKIHIMPNEPATKEHPVPIPKLHGWLNHFTCHAPITCVGIFYTHDLGLSVYPEHFHGFSMHGEGGHYLMDVTPNEIEYDCYFAVGKEVFRVLANHEAGLNLEAPELFKG